MYHIAKPFGRFIYNCRRRFGLSNKRYQVDVPVSKVPKKFNMTEDKKKKRFSLFGCWNEGRIDAQQIRETSHGFLVSKTSCRTVATRANWPIHRKPAMRSDTPIPNLNTVEMPMSRRTKAKEITTLIHVSSLLAIERGIRISGKNHPQTVLRSSIPVREKYCFYSMRNDRPFWNFCLRSLFGQEAGVPIVLVDLITYLLTSRSYICIIGSR